MVSRAPEASKRFLAALVLALAAAGCHPRDESPGLWLQGERATGAVEDWGFAREVEELFVETRPWYLIPHSTTIWCVVLDGDLYIGSYGDEKKAWEKHVVRNPEARLSISGTLYEVKVMPVTDPDRVEALDAVYEQKYDMVGVFGEALPDWWYYRVSARS